MPSLSRYAVVVDAKPSGEIIETPITATSVNGLTVFQILHLYPRARVKVG